MSKARSAPHQDAVDRMYMVAGIDDFCDKLLSLPEQVKQYTESLRREKEK